MSNDNCIAITAPVLRGLWADDSGLASVKFSEDTVDGAQTVSLSGTDAESIVAELKDVSGDAINIEGVGSFSKMDPIASSGRSQGKTALVTGAAQGFGYEIACSLASQGARVILSDINFDGVTAAAEKINAEHGDNTAVGVEMNVTSEESVQNSILEAVKAFGGMDILVANAGVVKAGGVMELSERDFDFTTNVNYKGYFLCAKHTAPVMAAQFAACPDRWSDIIQINSKSGLVGSNRNGAYAGSKFGGIGLTQSFAMELVSSGIKVNSVCPGNFLDGPLWSDPENGLFVQYLNSGKVPGAKTIEDVRKSYESKVPIGRGCTTEDVMHAIFYLVDQRYETGQAVPVTGGQEMLK